MPPGIDASIYICSSARRACRFCRRCCRATRFPNPDLYDYGINFVRTQLATVQGAQMPSPTEARRGRLLVDLDLRRSYTRRDFRPADVVQALTAQNLILPAGTQGGDDGLSWSAQWQPAVLDQLNDLPIKRVNGAIVYIRDVAHVHEGFAVQQNIVRIMGIARRC